jgi:hypothetical protein
MNGQVLVRLYGILQIASINLGPVTRVISASGTPSSLLLVHVDSNKHNLTHLDLTKLLKAGDARLDISHIATASLSLSVLMSHISGVIDEIRTQIKKHCSTMNQLRMNIANGWIEACGDAQEGLIPWSVGFPSVELDEFYDTWYATEEVYSLVKGIQGPIIGKTEKGATVFKEQMTSVGMSLYVGIMHAMTAFERVGDGGEDERRLVVEEGFFKLLEIVETDILLKVDQETSVVLAFCKWVTGMQQFLQDKNVPPTDACSYEEGVFAREYFTLEKSAFQDLAFTYKRGAIQGEGILKREIDGLMAAIDRHRSSLTVDAQKVNGPAAADGFLVQRDWVLASDDSSGIAKSLVFHNVDDSADESSARYITSSADEDGGLYCCALSRSADGMSGILT